MKLRTRTNEAGHIALRGFRLRSTGGNDAFGCGAVVPARQSGHPTAAFTLAEVLAALLFLAIVIPVAVEAMHIASLAGEVAARKGVAARIADRLLSESIVTTNWNRGTQTGTTAEGTLEFRWKLTAANWPPDAMQLLTAEVTFAAKGHDYTVKSATLANPQTLTTSLGMKQ